MAYRFITSATATGGGLSSIDISNIPSGYRDIVFLMSLRLASGIEAVDIRLNGDTTGNAYNWTYLQHTGTSFTRGYGSSSAFSEAMIATGNTSTANTFSNSLLWFPSYTSSAHKTFYLDTGSSEAQTTAYSRLEVGRWANTSAITSISIYGTSNLVANSAVYLYGIV